MSAPTATISSVDLRDRRATKAAALLRDSGLTTGLVLQDGFADWQRNGFDTHRGKPRWELERQVRLVAGSVVLTSVLGSVAAPRLKWLAAAIGDG